MSRAIEAVIFDMDGTITVPSLDFPRMKAEIGAPQDKGLLESMELMDGPARAAAERVLLRHELEAARKSALNPGAASALSELRGMGLRTAILTRNCRQSVEIVLEKHGLRLDAAVTREDSLPKPHPDGVLTAARRLGTAPERCVMVGDYEFDIQAGRAAGAVTVLLAPLGHAFETVPDAEIRSLGELPGLIRSLL